MENITNFFIVKSVQLTPAVLYSRIEHLRSKHQGFMNWMEKTENYNKGTWPY